MQNILSLSADTFGGNSWTTVLPLGIAGLVVWSLWLYRAVSSRFQSAIVTDFRTTTSVVVPSYREDPDILRECLHSWLAQDPDEVVVVVDVDDLACIEVLRAVHDPRLRPIVFRHEGKRSALGVGVRAAVHEVVILADSDTRWLPGLVEAVQMPFQDPAVGGVGTQQNVYQRRTSLWRRIADWMVDLRYYDMVPAMGRKGGVACLSGRTAAYRRSVITPLLPYLEHEFFLGRRCVAGDDGRLTWLVLAAGYKTVHQRSAKALSMFPDTFRGFVKQRVRWSRNSMRTYLTAVWKGWLWRAPNVTKIMVLQILVTPLTMGLALYYLFFSRLELTTRGMVLAGVWLFGGRLVRSYSHLRRRPLDLFLLPIYELVVIMVALPIKLYATVTMNKQGWLTRTAESVGGEGQGASTLSGPVHVGTHAAHRPLPGTAGHEHAGHPASHLATHLATHEVAHDAAHGVEHRVAVHGDAVPSAGPHADVAAIAAATASAASAAAAASVAAEVDAAVSVAAEVDAVASSDANGATTAVRTEVPA